jgi:hypothetical protein
MYHTRTFRSLLSWQMRRGLSSGRSARSDQRGWIGLIAILIALVIVAMLAQTLLKSSGLLGSGAPTKAGTRVPGPAAPVAPDSAAAPAAPTTPIESARGLEQQVQRDAQEQARRIDEQTK